MPITDPQTGQIDLRYNMMSNDQDFSSQLELKMHLTLLMYCLVLVIYQIADIEYLQRNLFTALRVPKPFLGFDDAGDGKNLAIQDIRFLEQLIEYNNQ
jgi:hypothetical protein